MILQIDYISFTPAAFTDLKYLLFVYFLPGDVDSTVKMSAMWTLFIVSLAVRHVDTRGFTVNYAELSIIQHYLSAEQAPKADTGDSFPYIVREISISSEKPALYKRVYGFLTAL